MRVIRPIWGFGPWGWALLPVAAALAYCICGGYDLRFALMQWWTDRFGWHSMLVTMIDWTIFPHALSAWAPICNVVTLIPVLLAMYFQPRRYPRWVWAGAVAWLLVNPVIWWNWPKIGFALARTDAQDMCIAIQLGIFGLLAGWMMRSVTAGLLVVAIGVAVGILDRWLNQRSAAISSFPDWMNWCWYGGGVVWHAGVAIVLVGGSIVRYRSCAREPWRCQACGYDVRGLAGTCPECGGATIQPTAA